MKTAGVAIVASLSVASGTGLRARQAPQAFHATVEGVRVDARVTNDGRSIAGLSPSDFELRDNGVVQHIDSATTSTFVTGAVLVDNTDSLSDAQFATLLDATRALVSAMHRPDTISLLTVNDKIALPLGANAPPQEVTTALDRIRRQITSRTPLWDAIAAAASLVVDGAGTRVVFVASDAGDNESWLARDVVKQSLSRAGIVVDWLATKYKNRTYFASPDEKFGAVTAPMEELVFRTGGQTFQANASNLKRLLVQHLTELRSSYVLTFTPTGVAHDDGWHKLEVKLKTQKGDVRARPGYFARDPKSP
jgi:VWFA-related protein